MKISIIKMRGLYIIFNCLALLMIGNLAHTDQVKAKENDFVIIDGKLTEYLGSEQYITIPDQVTTIGRYAFQSCTQLIGIEIPDSVNRIDFGAFEGCSNLDSIILPDSVKYLANNVFTGCKSLKSIRLSQYIHSIGDSAFSDCSSLERIQIPDGVTIIGWYAFMGCTNLIDITIPESVEYIGYYAFEGTIWLEDFEEEFVIINNMLVKYKGNDEKVVIPDGVISIEDGAFEYNNFLEEIEIPDSVARIDCGVFFGCTKIKEITIPDSVTLIGTDAFRDCSSLENIIIPDSVTEIYPNILKGTKYYDSFEGDFFEINEILLEYKGKDAVVTIPNHIKKVSTYAFYDNDIVTEISIPESVTWLESRIAMRCDNLICIKIPASVTVIEEELTEQCNNELEICGVTGSQAEVYAQVNQIPFEGITINISKATLYLGGTTVTTTLRITGTEQTITWATSNAKVAKVSKAGKVTAIAKGTAMISANMDGLIVSCKIIVKDPYLSSKHLTLKVGSSYTLSMKGFASGVTWSSTNSSKVKVSSTGKITALKSGTVIIKAKAGEKEYQCTIKVINK